MSNNSKYVLEMKTVQIAPVRTLMTALKDILLETNIIFNQNILIHQEKLYQQVFVLLIWINPTLFWLIYF